MIYGKIYLANILYKGRLKSDIIYLRNLKVRLPEHFLVLKTQADSDREPEWKRVCVYFKDKPLIFYTLLGYDRNEWRCFFNGKKFDNMKEALTDSLMKLHNIVTNIKDKKHITEILSVIKKDN